MFRARIPVNTSYQQSSLSQVGGCTMKIGFPDTGNTHPTDGFSINKKPARQLYHYD